MYKRNSIKWHYIIINPQTFWQILLQSKMPTHTQAHANAHMHVNAHPHTQTHMHMHITFSKKITILVFLWFGHQ